MIALPPGSEILSDAEAVARAAAKRLAGTLAEADPGPLTVCLAGGTTPERLYRLLAGPDFAGTLPFPRIHWFLGDERVVPWQDARSNAGMLRRVFGPDGPVPSSNLHLMATDEGAEVGARAYEGHLRRFHAQRRGNGMPLFDVVLLGLGGDGHTASLFPGRPALDEAEALAVAVPEAGLEPFVPRITLTYPALADSRLVLFLATGAAKADPLRRLAAGEDLPAGRVRSAGRVAWLLDQAAAGTGLPP